MVVVTVSGGNHIKGSQNFSGIFHGEMFLFLVAYLTFIECGLNHEFNSKFCVISNIGELKFRQVLMFCM